jgi:hypothetical protein
MRIISELRESTGGELEPAGGASTSSLAMVCSSWELGWRRVASGEASCWRWLMKRAEVWGRQREKCVGMGWLGCAYIERLGQLISDFGLSKKL